MISLWSVLPSCFAQSDSSAAATPADWTKPFLPFRIAGNLYYVGSCELGAYLITTSKGNILINSGTETSAAMIKANIERLGFRFTDTKILLTSQAHRDHVGAMAEIKKRTGAKFMVDEGDSAVVADGGKSDYAHAGRFVPLVADRYLRNGDTVSLGKTQVVMLHHPGHTKGSCSFLFIVTDETRSYRVLIVNLPTIITKKNFSAIPDYPGISTDYAATLAALPKLSFDIWLAPHASQFGLQEKQLPGDGYHPAAFIDRKRYDDELSELQAEYQTKINEK